MVGGMVIDVVVLADKVWVNCQEQILRPSTWMAAQRDSGGSYDVTSQMHSVLVDGDTCAIYVERTPESRSISEGDALWWQGEWAMWTPRTHPFEDRKLRRIGFSGVPHPSVQSGGSHAVASSQNKEEPK